MREREIERSDQDTIADARSGVNTATASILANAEAMSFGQRGYYYEAMEEALEIATTRMHRAWRRHIAAQARGDA